jgi:hypothetical protein
MTDSQPSSEREPRDARAIAQRNRDACGGRISPVMKTAATACELAHPPRAGKRDVPTSKH